MRILNIIMLSCLMATKCLAGVDTERIYVQTDKSFYLAGEQMKVKVYDVDEAFRLQELSSVCYIELVDHELARVQGKVHLKDGTGHASFEIPFSTPTGEYELVAYTRWMRNEGSKVFFRKKIAVFNALTQNEDDRLSVSLSEPFSTGSSEGSPATLSVTTNHTEYGCREAVDISIGEVPEGSTLAVSVARMDVPMEETTICNFRQSMHQATPFNVKWLPEIYGMIIEASGNPSAGRPNVSLQGRDVAYYSGQSDGAGHYSFYTPCIFGMRRLATGMERNEREEHLELLSPFVAKSELADDTLRLAGASRQTLLERSIALQAMNFYGKEAERLPRLSTEVTFPYAPNYVYDLDEYKRFTTVKESIVEFISSVTTVGSRRNERIRIFNDEEQAMGREDALVLLDGIAVMNHEDALNYNPHLLKWIEIYKGNYVFGNQKYNGIFALKTYDGESISYNMPANSKQVEFQGLELADEPIAGKQEEHNLPDMRHTLYWNPSVSSSDHKLTCYTSDLTGTFLITVEGVTPDGKVLHGTQTFTVR